MNILENILDLPLVCCYRSQSIDDSSVVYACHSHDALDPVRPSDWRVEEAACSTELSDWLIELLNLLNGAQ